MKINYTFYYNHNQEFYNFVPDKLSVFETM